MATSIPSFLGVDTHYPTADGNLVRRTHLDGAASPLPAEVALTSFVEFSPHYSNTHSHVHASAQISSQAFAWAQQQVLHYLNAPAEQYSAIFTGAGTTAGINRVARGLSQSRPGRPVVLVSAMEHHANDLPHRQFDNQVLYAPLSGNGAEQGQIDIDALETLLKAERGKVNYVAFSLVSNVTGIINPAAEICRLAHQYDALALVDAAQAVAHLDLNLDAFGEHDQPDFLFFSGHKIYCPTAPGVMLAKKEILATMSGQDLGGGAVNDVSYFDFELANLPDREHAGTPNIAGVVALGKVLENLGNYGKPNIEQHGFHLMNALHAMLATFEHITVYGDPKAKRIGALSFTHAQIEHGLLAALLNDYRMIAVRNECFCAHPYVSSLLKEKLWQLDLSQVPIEQHSAYINRYRGMVRVSLSLYNTLKDIEQLRQALQWIEANRELLSEHYEALDDGNFRHKRYSLDWKAQLGWRNQDESQSA